MLDTPANELSVVTAARVEAMSYNDLIGLVRETNRPPGGIKVLEAIASRLSLGPDKHLLEIGCATGWTSIELGLLTGCRITAIDLNPASVAEARRRADRAGLTNVKFEVADASDLPLESESVDVVFCGNVTSLVSDRDRVMREYVRVLKPGGKLVAIPMYYVDEPPMEVVDRVRKAIQVNIPVHFEKDACAPFFELGLDVHDDIRFRFDEQPVQRVADFCEEVLARPHLDALPPDARASLDHVYREQMELFRVNLALMGFSVLILRKALPDQEAELFSASVAPN